MPIKQTTLNGEPLNGPICFPSSFVRRVSSTLPFSLPFYSSNKPISPSLSPYTSHYFTSQKMYIPTRGKHRSDVRFSQKLSLSLSLVSRRRGPFHEFRAATRKSRKDIVCREWRRKNERVEIQTGLNRAKGERSNVTALTARHHDAATGADWTVIAFWVRLIDMGTRGGSWNMPPA